jgi:Flp pilus assembly protein TadB
MVSKREPASLSDCATGCARPTAAFGARRGLLLAVLAMAVLAMAVLAMAVLAMAVLAMAVLAMAVLATFADGRTARRHDHRAALQRLRAEPERR